MRVWLSLVRALRERQDLKRYLNMFSQCFRNCDARLAKGLASHSKAKICFVEGLADVIAGWHVLSRMQ